VLVEAMREILWLGFKMTTSMIKMKGIAKRQMLVGYTNFKV